MKLVGLCGYARVGKDTAAANMPGFFRFAFADGLKNDLRPLLHQVGCHLGDSIDKEKARPLLVAWGSVARAFKPGFWIGRLFNELDQMKVLSRVVITDCRYLNEINAIESRGGKIIRIERPCYGPANAEEAWSFAEIDEKKHIGVVINNSTPEDLGRKVLELVG